MGAFQPCFGSRTLFFGWIKRVDWLWDLDIGGTPWSSCNGIDRYCMIWPNSLGCFNLGMGWMGSGIGGYSCTEITAVT
jgi:hypothetical protein